MKLLYYIYAHSLYLNDDSIHGPKAGEDDTIPDQGER